MKYLISFLAFEIICELAYEDLKGLTSLKKEKRAIIWLLCSGIEIGKKTILVVYVPNFLWADNCICCEICKHNHK